MKIAVLSNHVSGLDCLRKIDRQKVPVNLIITTREELHAEKAVSGAADFASLGIPILYLDSFNLQKDVERIVSEKIDILLVMGFQRLVPQEIIDSIKVGAFGYHGSSEPLPKGRGRSPINWELIAGKNRFILHMFKLESDADSGMVYDQWAFDMNKFDTVQTVYYKISLAMRSMTENIVQRLIQKLPVYATPQLGKPSHFPKRTPADGVIKWPLTVEALHNFVRALTKPYPGAFGYIEGQKLTIYNGQPFSEFFFFQEPAGTILETFSSGSFLLKCSDGAFLVTDSEGPIPKVADILREI